MVCNLQFCIFIFASMILLLIHFNIQFTLVTKQSRAPEEVRPKNSRSAYFRNLKI